MLELLAMWICASALLAPALGVAIAVMGGDDGDQS